MTSAVSVAFATDGTTYNVGRLNQNSTYDGFWMQATLPTLNPQWSSGGCNKINFEYWSRVNNDSLQWIEMGYKKGYALNSDGSANCDSSYNGLFVGIKANGEQYKGYAMSSYNWNAGQNHTWGHVHGTSPTNVKYADMRTDGQAILTFVNVSPSNSGSMDVGIEWGHPGSSSSAQSISLPSSMYNLNTRISGTWKTWSTIGGVYNYNNHSGVTASFDSSNNKVNFTN